MLRIVLMFAAASASVLAAQQQKSIATHPAGVQKSAPHELQRNVASDPQAEPRWSSLPPTPTPVAGGLRTTAEINGVNLFYTDSQRSPVRRPPVILLHGGLANADYWGKQIPALSRHHRVIAIDSRGHGRSTQGNRPLSYELLTDDVIALMDHLHIPQADVVGWSDGAILALDAALRYPKRVRRVFAFAANTRADGIIPGGDKNPNFIRYALRTESEYRKLSTTPADYKLFEKSVDHMWNTQTNWTDAQLRAISARVLVADGDRDEVIQLAHTEYIAHTIPNATLLILPDTSHFAFLQAPDLFNASLLDFLDLN